MAPRLIGMLDSPYVRRVAISLQCLGLAFEHQSLSVFRTFDAFRQVNPVVKAPTFICADGTVLMDSTLILEYAQALARPRSLVPADPAALARVLRVIGLALAACEKSVQIVYERTQRPAERRHQPWLDRVTGQLHAAFDALELALAAPRATLTSATLDQATITTAVSWQFAVRMVADVFPPERYPALTALSLEAEALPEFRAAPFGADTFPVKP